MTLGIVFCDTGKVSTKEERLDWPVTEEERNSDKGWGRFGKEQICRLKIRRMKEELAKDLVVCPWCISEIVNAHEDCPELQAVLEEYHKPVVIQDQVLGELILDKDYDTFEGEIRWQGKNVKKCCKHAVIRILSTAMSGGMSWFNPSQFIGVITLSSP